MLLTQMTAICKTFLETSCLKTCCLQTKLNIWHFRGVQATEGTVTLVSLCVNNPSMSHIYQGGNK